MNIIMSFCSIDKLLVEALALDYKTDDSGARMAFKQSNGIPESIGIEMRKAVEEISQFRQLVPLHIMVNILPPGTIVAEHTDTLIDSPLQGANPRLERWHLPIQTNNMSLFWDEIEGYNFMALGFWNQVFYYHKHRVHNLGITDRIHLICDLDCKRRI